MYEQFGAHGVRELGVCVYVSEFTNEAHRRVWVVVLWGWNYLPPPLPFSWVRDKPLVEVEVLPS